MKMEKDMEYNEIYEICDPAMKWLKEHCPDGCKIVISKNSAEIITSVGPKILDKKTEDFIESTKGKTEEEIMDQFRCAFSDEESFEKFKRNAEIVKRNLFPGLK